jgi:hypothetical protein
MYFFQVITPILANHSKTPQQHALARSAPPSISAVPAKLGGGCGLVNLANLRSNTDQPILLPCINTD